MHTVSVPLLVSLTSTEVQQTGIYFLSTITYTDGILKQTVINNRYSDMSALTLETIRIFGAPGKVTSIMVNNNGVAHTDFEILDSNEIRVKNLKIAANSDFTITFSYSDSGSSAPSHFGYNFILFYVSLLYSLIGFVMRL